MESLSCWGELGLCLRWKWGILIEICGFALFYLFQQRTQSGEYRRHRSPQCDKEKRQDANSLVCWCTLWIAKDLRHKDEEGRAELSKRNGRARDGRLGGGYFTSCQWLENCDAASGESVNFPLIHITCLSSWRFDGFAILSERKF